MKREYPKLSLLELQRLIDLGWLDTSKPIDLTSLCNTNRIKVNPHEKQYGIHLTDEVTSLLYRNIKYFNNYGFFVIINQSIKSFL